MKKNINWFGSPIPKPTHFAHSNLNPKVELDESPTAKQPHSPNLLSCQNHLQHDSLHSEAHLNSRHSLTSKQEKINKHQIDEILVYSEDQQEGGLITPIQKQRKKQAVCTTSRKNQEYQQITDKKARPKDKGLKGVSARAYELIKICKETSYKEMANLLLKQFNPDGTTESRTEQINIRRRVYDALNVFLSLGILCKDGRRLVNDQPRKRSHSNIQQQYETLQLLLKEKQLQVKQKRIKLIMAAEKLKNARQLLKRNINHKNEEKQEIIPFPFVGIMGYEDCIDKQQTETSVTMRFSTMVFPFGDMDGLNYL